jgi:DSF synthase
VDVITPTGTGEAAVETFVRKHTRSGNGRRGIESIAREMNPLKHEELVRVVELWADAALKLSERDIRMMERIVRAQQRQGEEVAVVSAASNVVSLAVGTGD